jgi:hypothetical protein
VSREPFCDAHDLAAERLELQLDGLILDLARAIEDTRRRCDRNDVWHSPGSECSAGELHVLMACSPCVPPAVLISPTTLSCR